MGKQKQTINAYSPKTPKSQKHAASATSSPSTPSSVQANIISLEKSETMRYELLEFMVKKRIQNLDVLKKVHETETYWMNIVKIAPEDIVRHAHPKELQKQLQHWFYLGVSLAPLLQLSNGSAFIRGCAQLIEEFEYHFSNIALQSMKMLKAWTAGSSTQADEESKTLKPLIGKVNGQVVYEYLRTPNIPCELDYCTVVISLCDIVNMVYRKLMDETSFSAAIFERILKVDKKLKHHFLGPLSRVLNEVGERLIKYRLTKFDMLFTKPGAPQPLHGVSLVIPSTPGSSSTTTSPMLSPEAPDERAPRTSNADSDE